MLTNPHEQPHDGHCHMTEQYHWLSRAHYLRGGCGMYEDCVRGNRAECEAARECENYPRPVDPGCVCGEGDDTSPDSGWEDWQD
jgi:hypothetical protein